jgi:hypothetical protein
VHVVASTRGTALLPWPESLTAGVSNLGYTDSGVKVGGNVPMWRHSKFPDLYFIAITSNMPGSTDVTAYWKASPRARRLTVDMVVALLTLELSTKSEITWRTR